ncbi:MAG TPA: energy-coupling factor transporter transmembrane component T [Candidatus Aquicultor sp.]|jgi:energy-coupling factor transport system permease protein
MSVASGFTIGQYYPGDSIVHHADPRVKLVLVLLFSIAVFLIGNFTGFLVVAAAIVCIALIAELPLAFVVQGVRPLLFVLVFTVLIHIFTDNGPWLHLGPVYISVTGFWAGLLLGVRFIALVTGASFLTLTSTPIELTDAIESLLTPLKRIGLPAHELAMMMTIALRFIPILAVEADKIVRAQMSRGARFDARNPFTRANSYIPVLIPLLVNVFRRADELAEAMESRAYRGGEGRTRMRRLTLKASDIYAFSAVALIFAAIIAIGRMPLI